MATPNGPSRREWDDLRERLKEVENRGSPATRILAERVDAVRDDVRDLREDLFGDSGAIPAIREENRWLRRSLLLSLAFPLVIGLVFIVLERLQ